MLLDESQSRRRYVFEYLCRAGIAVNCLELCFCSKAIRGGGGKLAKMTGTEYLTG